mgnify:CR=1 FL=1|jgi:hypothetical protein
MLFSTQKTKVVLLIYKIGRIEIYNGISTEKLVPVSLGV